MRWLRLTKRRRRVPDGALSWEVDEFTDRRLILAEVELPPGEVEVPIPHWLRPFVIREVTDEEEFQGPRLGC